MTTLEAVKAWKEMRSGVTCETLQDQEKHQIVHEIFKAINAARINGELSVAELETL